MSNELPPSAQAYKDYKDGLLLSDNPYLKGTENHWIYQEAMGKYLKAELKNLNQSAKVGK